MRACNSRLANQTASRIAYIGNVGVHLDGLLDINQATPGTTPIATSQAVSVLFADLAASNQPHLQLSRFAGDSRTALEESELSVLLHLQPFAG